MTTPHLSAAEALFRRGRFLAALDTLGAPLNSEGSSVSVLRVQLLERLGRPAECRTLSAKLERAHLSDDARAVIELTLSRLEWSLNADTASALRHAQRARKLFESANHLAGICWSNIHLLTVLAETEGPSCSSSLLDRLRRDVITLGDAQVLSALHIAVGHIDAKRGLLDSAR